MHTLQTFVLVLCAAGAMALAILPSEAHLMRPQDKIVADAAKVIRPGRSAFDWPLSLHTQIYAGPDLVFEGLLAAPPSPGSVLNLQPRGRGIFTVTEVIWYISMDPTAAPTVEVHSEAR